MSSGVFRGKKFTNRIELSQLVQDLLNFGVLGSLQLWGWGWVDGGVGGGRCPHTCTHACTCTHMHAHTCTEIANGCRHGGIHVYHVYHVYACVCMCVYMHACMGHTPTHPYPPLPPFTNLPPPRGAPPESVKIR